MQGFGRVTIPPAGHRGPFGGVIYGIMLQGLCGGPSFQLSTHITSMVPGNSLLLGRFHPAASFSPHGASWEHTVTSCRSPGSDHVLPKWWCTVWYLYCIWLHETFGLEFLPSPSLQLIRMTNCLAYNPTLNSIPLDIEALFYRIQFQYCNKFLVK